MSLHNSGLDNLSDHDLLIELVKKQRSNFISQIIMTAATVAIFLALTTSLVIIVPKTVQLLSKLNKTVEDAQVMIADAGESLDQIDIMVNNLNTTVTDNSENLTEAVEKMNNVDFDTLNKAIQDLSDTVEPMAKFFNQFKRN